MSEAQAQGQAAPEGQATQEAQPTEEQRSFTQADLKKIAANEKREGRTAAVNELLEKTGAESIDDLLAAYTEYQGIQEAVTTEADRANTRAEKMEARAKAAEANYTNTLREFALRDALRDRDVPKDRIADALALAKRDQLEVDKDGNISGIDEVVTDLLEPRPWLLEAEQPKSRVNAPQTTGTGVQKPGDGADPDVLHGQFLANLLGRET